MSSIIAALDRGLEVLLLLYGKGREMGVSEIADELDCYKSTVHRTLVTLEQKHFVYKNPKTEKYWLGMSLYTLGLLVADQYSLAEMIAPFARKLHNEVKEVINVSILHYDRLNGYRSVVIYKVGEDKQVLAVNPSLGSSMDAHVSSVGKCLLAHREDIDFSIYDIIGFTKYTENSLTRLSDLKKELDTVRKNGYAIDNEEREYGLYCVGAPILNADGIAVAAMSISGPKSRIVNSELDLKIKKLCRTTQELFKYTKNYKA